MKINKPSIDILVGITNRELLDAHMSIETYGEALARAVPGLQDNWISYHTNLYILCRDTDLSFEEYLDLCDAIGDTVVYHGKVITNQEQLSTILAKAKRIHIPTNLMRYWQAEQQALWDILRKYWTRLAVWSTVHNEDDISFFRALQIPHLECVLISPIFRTACKEGHPGIGVERGETLLQQIREHYPHVQGIALGGIHEHNYVECLQHTFTGVAVMSEFMKYIYQDLHIKLSCTVSAEC